MHMLYTSSQIKATHDHDALCLLQMMHIGLCSLCGHSSRLAKHVCNVNVASIRAVSLFLTQRSNYSNAHIAAA